MPSDAPTHNSPTDSGPVNTGSTAHDIPTDPAEPDSSVTGESLAYPVLPATGGVVFPEMVVTIALESDEAKAAVAAANDRMLLILPKRGESYASVGTLVQVESHGDLPNGTQAAVVRGVERAIVGAGVLGTGDALWVQTSPVPTPVGGPELDTLTDEYRATARALLAEAGARGLVSSLADVTDPSALADTAAWWPDLSTERKIELLETVDTAERLRKAIDWLKAALAEVQVAKKIRAEVNSDMEKTQRDYVLRQQLTAIQKELGDDTDAVGDYRTKLADADLSEAIEVAVAKEIDRLEKVGEQSQESSWIRTWLDTVFELPWNERSVDNLDLSAARGVLDADHTGLDDVKDRIVDHLAVRKLRSERDVPAESGRGSGMILSLIGPPGVGKTSLGESIASSLGRKFVRVSLGGVSDEAEIRGHRRTYVGARPGRIARALIDSGSMNPVILLDEVDKLGNGWRGDPSSALLEVLDPAQNHTFRDHYLEFELDLSDVIFLATANVADTIPGPLLDRMEIITISGYSEDEKLVIAADHLLPRMIERNGLRPEEVDLAEGTLATIIGDYTREAGVRRLEQRLDRVVRQIATKLAFDEAPPTIGPDDLHGILGRPIPREDVSDRTRRPGVATGLSVSGAGGDVLFVETASVAGEPGLTLTGQLGDVMKESAEIARTYLRANAERLDISSIADRHLHVHFPAGAIPKDGPSAGVAMTTALVSLLTDKPIRAEVAMTGEVTIQGRVLPIGGVKEKVLAAHRAGLTEVILPEKNGPDMEDVPEHVREKMTIHLVSDVDDALKVALAA